MPFFSIIIPVFNKAHFVENAINSVLQQDFKDFEIILINDGSTDHSYDILQTFAADNCRIINQENKGVPVARNKGIQISKGHYLVFLDADDSWKSHHLSELKKSIELFPNAGLYGNNYDINYNNQITLPAKFSFEVGTKPKVLDSYFKAALADSPIWTSASCVPKKVLDDIGTFNKVYKTGQDLDLWIRIALKYEVVFNPASTMIYNRYVENSLSKGELNQIRLDLFSSYKTEESNNVWLKKYLDVKRYGLALRTKINNETPIYKATIAQIDFKNLSFKQRLLLGLPHVLLNPLNNLRTLIISKNWYLRLFKS